MRPAVCAHTRNVLRTALARDCRLCSNSLPKRTRARRIILVRHGQSTGNVDESQYVQTPDWRIPLTDLGREQARDAGRKLRELIGPNGRCLCYVSPYVRTRQTLAHVLEEVVGDSTADAERIIAVREEPRMAEQQFGNFQNVDAMRIAKQERRRFGRFFFRFPNGESGLDVYNRVTSFISTLRRDNDALVRTEGVDAEDLNVIVCTHGLAMRLFLMRYYQIGVDQFERTLNPKNAAIVIMESRCEPVSDNPDDGFKHWYELTEDSQPLLAATPGLGTGPGFDRGAAQRATWGVEAEAEAQGMDAHERMLLNLHLEHC